MERLQGKVAVITGGTSGIGRRMVQRFVEEGAHVVFSGRRAEEGAEVADATGARFIQADVTREEDARRTIALAEDTHGRLDILVNNAGSPHPTGRIQDLKLEDVDHALSLHILGALGHIKHAAPGMRERRSGSIINIGSVAAHRAGLSASIAYGVAKAGLVHLTRCVAMELGEDNIRSNSISPGSIATGIFAKTLGITGREADDTAERVKDRLATLQAIPRAGLPDDIAHAAVFLASDEAGFVNGEDMIIDGGMIWGRRYSEANAGGSPWKKLFE